VTGSYDHNKGGNFLTSWAALSFSKGALLHGVHWDNS